MTEFQQGLEAAARTLEILATGHAIVVKDADLYVWTDRTTLIAAATAIRAANGLRPLHV